MKIHTILAVLNFVAAIGSVTLLVYALGELIQSRQPLEIGDFLTCSILVFVVALFVLNVIYI